MFWKVLTMIKYEDLKVIRKLNHGKNDTNSVVVLMKDKQGNCFVRKAIYGISHPLYQEIFNREIRALYKLIIVIISYKLLHIKLCILKINTIRLDAFFWSI